MPILHFTGAFVVMSLGLGLMLQPLKMDIGNSVALLRQLTTNSWGILSVTIVGTLAEELTYRAGILRLTQKHIGNIGAFILSSLMFAVRSWQLATRSSCLYSGLCAGLSLCSHGRFTPLLGCTFGEQCDSTLDNTHPGS